MVTYTLGQSVWEISALVFFYKRILGVHFLREGSTPTVGGGRGLSIICAAGPCTVCLHNFFWGPSAIFCMYACVHACAHASASYLHSTKFALTF